MSSTIKGARASSLYIGSLWNQTQRDNVFCCPQSYAGHYVISGLDTNLEINDMLPCLIVIVHLVF